jgi:hypothetical protein
MSKGQFYEIMYFVLTCCGGPLYDPAVYSKIRSIRETGFKLFFVGQDPELGFTVLRPPLFADTAKKTQTRR